MPQYKAGILLLVVLSALASIGLIAAQDAGDADPSCNPQTLAAQHSAFVELLPVDFEADAEAATANLFRLGAMFQDMALRCGYGPSEHELNAMIGQVLSLTDVGTILAANAVGDDVEAILTRLETVSGDPLNGQLLYNGLEPALDGTELGCSGCHAGTAAPPTEATWTRVSEIRLADPALSDYGVEQYLVESIVHPNAYVVPDYVEGLMPVYYGSRLDIQQLADIVAFLDSQDQLIEE